jgi:hypothetical protein
MKKIFSAAVACMLLLSNGVSVLSQKTRNLSAKTKIIKKEVSETNIKLGKTEAFSDGGGVYLRWQTEAETKNLGFYVYRLNWRGRQQVNESLIPGGYLRSSESVAAGLEYSFYDAEGDLNSAYVIESLALDGQRQSFAPVPPKYVGDLREVSGQSAEQLSDSSEKTGRVVESNAINIPAELQKQFEANVLPPDITTQRWVAAQPGVKISVKQEGLYRVSRAELQAAGFDVNAPGNLWQLYTEGREQAIIVGANDSHIEFYGKGIDTPESATKVYYLIAGSQNGKRISTTILRPLAGIVRANNFSHSFIRKERSIYISSNILNGEEENFFGAVPIIANAPSPATVNFNLSAVDFSSQASTFELGIQGLSSTAHQILVTLNGEPLGPITGGGFVLMRQSFPIPTSFLREGNNVLQFQSQSGTSLPESIRVDYSRKYEANQNRLSFYTANYRTSTVSGFTSPNIRVFDLTYPDTPSRVDNLRIDNNSGNYSVNLPSNRGRVMYAVEDSAILQASSVAPNNPSTLATAAHNGEMIIVTYKDFLTQANDWANYRRGQGMSVEVVDADDIFDEFSYGSVNTLAMTNFFQYAKNNWQTAPNYILLIGDMTYDFRNYENRPFQNFVPTKLVDTVYEETGSDEALCDFNNDGLAEIAIGRIPAKNTQTITQLLNKTMAFESTVSGALDRGSLCASDSSTDYDFDGVCQRISNQLPTSMPKTFINRGQPDARNLLLTNLNTGKYMVNYAGHGTFGTWASTSFFSSPDALVMTNTPNYSLFIMLTCLNGYFLNTTNDGFAESLLKAQNGGAVTTWASTGKTTPDIQEIMATRFYNQIGAGNITRIGDLIRDSKETLVGGRDVRLSWTLLGDPALKVR